MDRQDNVYENDPENNRWLKTSCTMRKQYRDRIRTSIPTNEYIYLLSTWIACGLTKKPAASFPHLFGAKCFATKGVWVFAIVLLWVAGEGLCWWRQSIIQSHCRRSRAFRLRSAGCGVNEWRRQFHGKSWLRWPLVLVFDLVFWSGSRVKNCSTTNDTVFDFGAAQTQLNLMVVPERS